MFSRIFLIGPMGVGKTAVGRRLAAMLGYQFIDSDNEIEARTGVDVDFIFEKEGEAGFRRRESAVIDELTLRQDIVLATGGGSILDEANRRCLSGRGYVVYLQASIDQQLARTSRSDTRPLLRTENPRARLEQLIEIRGPIYTAMADFAVLTDGRRVDGVARHIKHHLDELSRS